jgi:hypothetical protein
MHIIECNEVLGTPEHVLSEWLGVDSPNQAAADELVQQLEASYAREPVVERGDGTYRVRWR